MAGRDSGSDEDVYEIPRPGRIKLKESSRDKAERIYQREAKRFQRQQERIARINNLPPPPFFGLNLPFPPPYHQTHGHETPYRHETYQSNEEPEAESWGNFNVDEGAVPLRHRTARAGIFSSTFGGIPPMHGLSADEYAQTIRGAFYRAVDIAEMASRQSRRAEEVRAEHDRLVREEQEAEDRERKRRRKEKREREKIVMAVQDDKRVKRERYVNRWKALVDTNGEIEETNLSFGDIPWPTYSTISKEHVKEFMLDMSKQSGEDVKRTLREAIRAFHPDRFFGRILPRVRESDRESVKEGVEASSRIINALAAES